MDEEQKLEDCIKRNALLGTISSLGCCGSIVATIVFFVVITLIFKILEQF